MPERFNVDDLAIEPSPSLPEGTPIEGDVATTKLKRKDAGFVKTTVDDMRRLGAVQPIYTLLMLLRRRAFEQRRSAPNAQTARRLLPGTTAIL